MKLYSFFTKSHLILKDQWFLPSIKDDYEIICEEHEQDCDSGVYMKAGWGEAMKKKVDLIIRAIEENWGEVFVHSDVDIQFFKPTKDIILELIKNKDMVIQRATLIGVLCPGFFAARGNNRNLNLWKDIRDGLNKQCKKHDQDLLNDKLCHFSSLNLRSVGLTLRRGDKTWISNQYGIKWSYLPETFFTGMSTSNSFPQWMKITSTYIKPYLWVPGKKLDIPTGIVMHHANSTMGLDNKIEIFKYVKGIVSARAPYK